MTELAFDCVGARPDRAAAAPTLAFRLRVAETTGQRVHLIALRCQLRIEPQRRRYSPGEGERLADLFGEPARWGETLRPMQLATVSLLVGGFQGSTEFDVPVPCTFDMEVAAAKYLSGLEAGEAPLLLLFSGTVFRNGPAGIAVEQVPWHKEADHRLPVKVWRELLDLWFPGSGWIRVRRDTLDALARFKTRRAIPTWDAAMEALLGQAEEREP